MHPTQQHADTTPPARPESISLLARVWGLVLGAELLHQVLSVVMTLMDTSALKAATKEIAETQGVGEEIPESLLTTATYLGVSLSGMIAIGIVALLTWLLRVLHTGHKWAPAARRVTMIFAFYFVVRAVMIFSLTPGHTNIPVGFYAADGSLQILAGVGAAVALVFVFRRETLVWTGELKSAE
ncbi:MULTISPECIES: hypothetical protein [unclassified Corynebacterium]|uniref:hypothetical protein n=1 Tax=unclassified Corynebacterium TaxID=2624378 RepID=UPI0029CA49E4|nr:MULTISPECIES: hypothetical protein [unclassified Corynebacterium]WPF66397.1 hypothetical protein OLX12_01320 [Corynebacterium sp. 22KM0430]WPF68887.1 hypothetical protein OLW90_01320 [Corynebacterium sp. 21KM1197]